MIYFTYNTGDLDPDAQAGYNYDEITLSTEVGSDGSYEIEVPAVATGVDYTVTFADFAYDQSIVDPNDPNETVTERVVFTHPDDFVTVHENATIINDYVYN